MSQVNYVYRKDHIPRGTACNRRPALPLDATSITIHNNGNPTSTAANERDWLTNPTNDRTASFHIVVDATEAVEVLPLNENAWHAGDGSGAASGNRTSIGIEICERDLKLGEYAQALTNAIHLVAKMLHERGWGVDRLRRHYDWSGKICPRLMHDGGKWTGWYSFVQRVDENLKELKGEGITVNKSGFKDVPDNHWAATSIKKAADKGLITGVSDGVFDPNGYVTRAQLAVILDRAELLK